MAQPTESRFIDVCGVRLHAACDGSRDGRQAVLILHGFTGSAESMEGVAGPLLDDYFVVRLELVGHGESDAPEDVGCYSMDACVQQVLAAVGALDLGRPHLIGYSMGGRTALSAALAKPDCFSSLTLVGATAGIADAAARRERIAADEALANRIAQEGLEAFVDHWMSIPLFASQKRLGANALGRARAERMKNSPSGLANSLRGMGSGAQTPVFDRLRRYEGPIQLVVGDEDKKFQDIAAVLEAGCFDARTAIVSESGHAAHLEQPEAFAVLVKDFLARAGCAQPGGDAEEDVRDE